MGGGEGRGRSVKRQGVGKSVGCKPGREGGTAISQGRHLCSGIRGLQEAGAGAQGHFLLLMELNLNRP